MINIYFFDDIVPIILIILHLIKKE